MWQSNSALYKTRLTPFGFQNASIPQNLSRCSISVSYRGIRGPAHIPRTHIPGSYLGCRIFSRGGAPPIVFCHDCAGLSHTYPFRIYLDVWRRSFWTFNRMVSWGIRIRGCCFHKLLHLSKRRQIPCRSVCWRERNRVCGQLV